MAGKGIPENAQTRMSRHLLRSVAKTMIYPARLPVCFPDHHTLLMIRTASTPPILRIALRRWRWREWPSGKSHTLFSSDNAPPCPLNRPTMMC